MTQTRDGPNWKKIKAEYIRGGISQEKLASKHGVSYATLRRRAEREKWRELKIEREQKVAEKLPEKIADIQSDTAAKLLRIQSEAAVAIYEKILSNIANYPDGVGTRAVRETVDVKKVKVNGEYREFPLKSAFVNDIEATVRSMTALAKLYGIDAASQLSHKRFDLQRQQGGASEDVDSFNENMVSIAELINHPMPNRTIADVETGGDDNA